ncbi:MAG: HIT domain-containing protein [Kiritimatiellae bacterium]|nr:HIT domain-containing protein [Kiritimatiellia bacterium]
MDTLWAPWRMEYIRAPRESAGCFLCDAFAEGADERERLVVLRSRHGGAVLNRYPYNNGHLLIAPMRHVAELRELDAEERLDLMNLLERAVALLRRAMRPDGFNAGLNLGRVAGAGLESHLHLHLVPRWNGDTNFMPVTAATKVIPQALDDLWVELRRLATEETTS